jgi:hypothetical protein
MHSNQWQLLEPYQEPRQSNSGPSAQKGPKHVPVHVLEKSAHKQHPEVVQHGIQIPSYWLKVEQCRHVNKSRQQRAKRVALMIN